VRRVALIGSALVVAACAPPAPSSPASTAASSVATAQRRHEFPATSAPVREAVGDPRADPESAVRAFAGAYINWTAATVTARLRTLASLSVGQARAAMTLAASETARDYELRRSGVANHGTVEAVAPVNGGPGGGSGGGGAGAPGSGAAGAPGGGAAGAPGGGPGQYVVVTRELTTATATDAYRGLRPAWHVALATVTRLATGGWALSGWQPEN
jgi:hypothetical protein